MIRTQVQFSDKSDTVIKTIPLHFVLHCISLTLSCTSESDLRVPPPWDQMYKLHVHLITRMDTLFKMQ